MSYGTPFLAAAALVAVALPASAQAPKPKELPEAAVVGELHTIRQADLPKLSKPFVVEGETRFDGWFVVADRIVFKSGARLVFTRQALERRRNFYIVAAEMSSEDGANPGTITYEPPPASTAPATPGQAPTGPHGPSDGASGGTGQSGQQGAEGGTGFAAPSLTVTVMKVATSGPTIDFRGGPGEQGGQGQKGGDGGVGRQGSPASSSLFDCKAGGGRGGDGGLGGRGGPGGRGGRGGPGGTVTIMSPADLLPSLSTKFRLLVSAGQPGQSGMPGEGGGGGPAGAGGQEAKPYCGGGDGGAFKGPGQRGDPGLPGLAGVDGDFLVGAITPEQFAYINK